MGTKCVQARVPPGYSLSPDVLTQFQLLAQGSPTGLFLLDREGSCVYMNPRAAVILQVALPTGAGGSWAQVFGVENAADAMASWHAAAPAQYAGSFRVRMASSACRWMEIRTSPVSHRGCVVAHSGVVEDVSDRWLNVRRLAARDAITRILAASDSIDNARNAVLTEIGEILGWAMGVFWEQDEQSNTLRPSAVWKGSRADLNAFEIATRNTRLPRSVGLPGRVWSTGEPAWVSDVTLDPNFPRFRAAAQNGLHGALAFPVTVGDRILAVAEFFSAAAWEPDPDLLHLVGVLGSQIGQFISRKRQETQLRQSEDRFWQVAQNIGEVLWIAEPSAGRLVYISPAFETIWGSPRETFLRDPSAFLTTIHVDDRARAIAFRERAFRGIQTEEEYRIVRRDGTVSWIRDLAFPVQNADGALEHVVGLAVDISERIDRQQRCAQQAKADAITTLAGGLAHDLNNLLTGVLGNADLAANILPEDHPAKALIRESAISGERAAQIVAQVLAYAGKGRFFDELLDISALVRDFLRGLQAAPANIQLRVELEDRLPRVEGDRNQLLQLIGNLYLNAVESIGDRPGSIAIATARESCGVANGNALTARQSPAAEYVCVRVTDTGCGIDEATLPRIFDPFFTTKFVGRGLGLSAAQGIMRAHNGVIRAASQREKGSTFTCLFPALPDNAVPRGA
jgi:PAS domain S-box-containing protein